jgi:hypothetical protein
VGCIAALAIGPQTVFVVDNHVPMVHVFDMDGTFRSRFPAIEPSNAAFVSDTELVVQARSGRVYVFDAHGGDRLRDFNFSPDLQRLTICPNGKWLVLKHGRTLHFKSPDGREYSSSNVLVYWTRWLGSCAHGEKDLFLLGHHILGSTSERLSISLADRSKDCDFAVGLARFLLPKNTEHAPAGCVREQ